MECEYIQADWFLAAYERRQDGTVSIALRASDVRLPLVIGSGETPMQAYEAAKNAIIESSDLFEQLVGAKVKTDGN